MDVKIWNIAPCKLAYVEHIGPYQEVCQAWEKLCTFAGPNGLFNEKTKFFGVYYDDPGQVAPEKLRSEACISVENELPESGDVQFRNFAGGKFAATAHLGPYETLIESWTDFYEKWLPQSGEELGEGPCYEQYMNDPKNTAPEHLVTILLMPLK